MSLFKKIKVRMHSAYFVNDATKKPFAFINIRNNYKRRSVIITNIWSFYDQFSVDDNGYLLKGWKEIQNIDRPLPFELKAQSEWETWISMVDLYPGTEDTILVRLSNGKFLTSSRRKGVAYSGQVPDGKRGQIKAYGN